MIVVEYRLTGIEVLTRSQVIDGIKNALRRMGEYWHEAFAWKRFTELGYSEYRFRKRSPRYVKAKLLHRGHNNPLVASGEARDEALSEHTKARIKVTRDTVRIPMPRKLNRYNPKGPNLAEEVRRVTRAELDILERNLASVWIPDELDKQVPPHLRRRGFTGGRAKGVRLKTFRPRAVAPLERRAAA